MAEDKPITTLNITLIFVIIKIFNENFQNQNNTTFWPGKINLSSITYFDIWLLFGLRRKILNLMGKKSTKCWQRLIFFFKMIRNVWKCLQMFQWLENSLMLTMQSSSSNAYSLLASSMNIHRPLPHWTTIFAISTNGE